MKSQEKKREEKEERRGEEQDRKREVKGDKKEGKKGDRDEEKTEMGSNHGENEWASIDKMEKKRIENEVNLE